MLLAVKRRPSWCSARMSPVQPQMLDSYRPAPCALMTRASSTAPASRSLVESRVSGEGMENNRFSTLTQFSDKKSREDFIEQASK